MIHVLSLISFALICCTVSAAEFLGVDYSQSDKQGHFWLGAATAGASILVLEKFDPESRWYTKLLVGTGAAALVGAAKEWSDGQDPIHHTVDQKDFVATATGGAVLSLTLCWTF